MDSTDTKQKNLTFQLSGWYMFVWHRRGPKEGGLPIFVLFACRNSGFRGILVEFVRLFSRLRPLSHTRVVPEMGMILRGTD